MSPLHNLVVVTLSLVTDIALRLFLEGRGVEAFLLVLFSIFVFAIE